MDTGYLDKCFNAMIAIKQGEYFEMRKKVNPANTNKFIEAIKIMIDLQADVQNGFRLQPSNDWMKIYKQNI